MTVMRFSNFFHQFKGAVSFHEPAVSKNKKEDVHAVQCPIINGVTEVLDASGREFLPASPGHRKNWRSWHVSLETKIENAIYDLVHLAIYD